MKRKLFSSALILASMIGMKVFEGELVAQSSLPVAGARNDFNPYERPAELTTPEGISRFPRDRDNVYFNERQNELSTLDQRTEELAAQLRAKPDATKEVELKALVEKAFDKRHAAQVAETKALADRLAKMQEILKTREAKKSEIVARRVKQLLGEADELDWNLTAPRSSAYQGERPGSPYRERAK
jgi:hypothetical protein